jgi:hypothetical protein
MGPPNHRRPSFWGPARNSIPGKSHRQRPMKIPILHHMNILWRLAKYLSASITTAHLHIFSVAILPSIASTSFTKIYGILRIGKLTDLKAQTCGDPDDANALSPLSLILTRHLCASISAPNLCYTANPTPSTKYKKCRIYLSIVGGSPT